MYLHRILVTKKFIDLDGMILSSLKSIFDNYLLAVNLVFKFNAFPFVLLDCLIGAYDVYQVIICLLNVFIIWNVLVIKKLILLSIWNKGWSDSILALRLVPNWLLIISCALRSLLNWCYTLSHNYLGVLFIV